MKRASIGQKMRRVSARKRREYQLKIKKEQSIASQPAHRKPHTLPTAASPSKTNLTLLLGFGADAVDSTIATSTYSPTLCVSLSLYSSFCLSFSFPLSLFLCFPLTSPLSHEKKKKKKRKRLVNRNASQKRHSSLSCTTTCLPLSLGPCLETELDPSP